VTALSIVIPAFNESATIANTLRLVREYLNSRHLQYQVIVCADGTDGTREAAAEFAKGDLRFQIIGSPERGGKGRGVRSGILRATGDIVGFIDADYKTPIEELDKLLPWFEQGYDLVIGSRKVADAQVSVAQPLHRRMGSRAFHRIMQGLVGLSGICDTQCGFKFFTRDAARQIFSQQRIDGYMFDVEVLRLAKLLNLRVKEVGVRWRDDGDSRYDPIAGTWRNARELLRIRQMRYEDSALLHEQAATNAQLPPTAAA
jgi:dolichyl-phosphate beta-glucosyltransferase